MTFPIRITSGLAVVGGLLTVYVASAIDPAKPAAEAISKQEQQALKELHHNAVEIFVDRPGFGIRRLVMNLDDLITAPKSLADLYKDSQQADQPKPDPKADKKPSHYAVQDLLVERGGRFPTDDGKESWQLSKLHLVGLVKHKEPVVYLEDRNPKERNEAPKAETEIPTRALDAFEKTALAAIRGGESMKAEKSGKSIRLMAPIYAGQRCTACHDRGALLGGFTYELKREAYDEKKDGKRRSRDR
jgi:hypothetical protein